MKKRTIYITLFLIFIIGVISLIGTFAIDSTITEGNSTKADYLFNITLGDRTNREIVIPSYDSKIVDIKISNPNEFNMSYLLYLEGVNSNISIINISDTEASGVLNSKNTNLIKVFIQNNSSSDITTSIKDIVGFEKETLSLPSNSTSINKGVYYKSIVKSNNKDYGKVKPNIKLSTNGGTVKYTLVPNTGYQYKSTTCNGTVSNNILTISNITSNTTCEVVFEPKQITVNFDLAGGVVETTYTEPNEHTYTVPYNGTYKLETWGAQGGSYSNNIGGYGGYSVGVTTLNSGSKLYVNVGGTTTSNIGGYNGGGNGYSSGDEKRFLGGGGATHIATKSGLLFSLVNYKDTILIVAGGGGGIYYYSDDNKASGGHGGGFAGNNGQVSTSWCFSGTDTPATGGTQSGGGLGNNDNTNNKGSFGQGGTGTSGYNTGGGGGFYGGGGTYNVGCSSESGAGGSGYIGNSLLTDKYMYCYNCTTSDVTDTKTYTTTNTSSTPISNYAKSGNGAAKITLVDNANYKVIYNTKYSNLPTPTRSDYTFMGWYTGENGTGTKVTSDTLLKNANTHTLYAKWIKDVKVTYDGNIFTPSINYKVDNGLTITYDPNTSYLTINGTPTTSGQSLGIMYNLSFTEGEKYASKVTYISGSYNNTDSDFGCFALDVKNSNGVGVSTRNYADLRLTTSSAETILTINSAGASEGDRFQYWLYLNDSSKWTFTNYTVKLDLSKIESKTILHGQKYGTMPTPTRTGYTFEGWYTGENGTGTKVTNDTVLTNENNHTLYAKWKINNITVTYDGNIFTPSINYKVDNGLTITYDPNTSYLTINGTPTTSGQSLGIMYNLSFTEGEKYASKVTYISGSYNNTDSDFGCFALDVKNSNGVGVSTRNYADLRLTTSSAETILTINSAGASEGDRFQYWLYLNDSSKWTFTNYTVKLDLSKIESKTILHGQKYGTMPTPTRTGYTFEGWYTGENGTGTKITSDTVLTNENNHTLYANWTVNSYYLDLNGMLNGNSSGYLTGYGTADVYINGILVCNDCDDYYSEHPYGTAYSISDIKTTAGHTYNGVYSGSASGTITGTTAVYLNFSTSDTSAPTCSLSASGSNITASASDNVGLSYQGWDSSYSGTSITSKDISAGTHTYYVKDTAGNTNTCSISISGLVEKDIPYTETSAAYANYGYKASGQCTCRSKNKVNGSYKTTIVGCVVSGSSAVCSCGGTTPIVSSNGCSVTKYVTSYYCPGNGKVSGSTCIYTKYKITYACPDGYSGVSGNSNFCYKY